MKIVTPLILMLGLVTSLFAVDLSTVNTELQFDKSAQYKEGDIIPARLQIWPVDDQEKKFNIKVGTYIDDAFYVADIVSQKRSENNADVVQIELLLVLVQVPKNEKLTIDLGEGKINVAHGIKATGTEVKQPALVMFNQESEGFGLGGAVWSMIVLGLIVLGLALFKLVLMYMVKTKQEREKEKFKKYWAEKFNNVEGRSDFEVVYGRKKEWLRLVKLQTPPLVEFFRVMEDVQYKKEWSEDDREIVKETFDNIRGIFN